MHVRLHEISKFLSTMVRKMNDTKFSHSRFLGSRKIFSTNLKIDIIKANRLGASQGIEISKFPSSIVNTYYRNYTFKANQGALNYKNFFNQGEKKCHQT